MKNPWSDRNFFVKQYIPDNISIVDFGCGNKEILDFCRPKKYLGIDIIDEADLKIDLNNSFELDDIYDLGLLLGVLEYVRDPSFTLSNTKKFAKRFIILSLLAKKKHNWNQAFTSSQIDDLMNTHFKNVNHYRHGSYMLSVGDVL